MESLTQRHLIQWVEKAKHTNIATLLTALWIAWVGKKTAKTLAQLFEKNGFIKVEVALAKGKKDYDKRDKIDNKRISKEMRKYK